jgi:hypothetical protein
VRRLSGAGVSSHARRAARILILFGIRKRVTYILVLFGCAGMTGRETVETVPGVCDVAITQLKESVGEFVPSRFPSD